MAAGEDDGEKDPETGKASPADEGDATIAYSAGSFANTSGDRKLGGKGFDFKALPTLVHRILKDPAGSLEQLYRQGKPALIQGLTLGAASAVLIPPLQVLFHKMSYSSYPVEAGHVFKQCLGGLLFLAAGVALSFFLRGMLGRSPGKNWQDDVYLFGSAMLFLLAGTLAGGILSLIHERFFLLLASAMRIAGLLLMAFTYCSGLVKVTKADASRGVWITVLAVAGGILAGSLLDFSIGASQPAVDFSNMMQRQFQDMEGMFKGLGR